MSATGVLILGSLRSGAGPGDEAERKAVAYLAAEVPRWATENHCYSCHNNGDAARSLPGEDVGTAIWCLRDT